MEHGRPTRFAHPLRETEPAPPLRRGAARAALYPPGRVTRPPRGLAPWSAGCRQDDLAASYLDGRGRPAAWFQVDDGDADPAAFFHYLAVLAPEAGLPTYAPDHGADLAAFARRFFRPFFAALADSTLLVLDNVHEALGSRDFSALLLASLAETPAHFRLLLVSRDEPPPAWARPVATGTLATLGGRELLLNTEEVLRLQDVKCRRRPNRCGTPATAGPRA